VQERGRRMPATAFGVPDLQTGCQLSAVGKRICGAPDLGALGSGPQCSDVCMLEQVESFRAKEGKQKQ
jgi:hypothetical protein